MAIGTSLYDEEGPPVWVLASAGFRDYTYLKALGFRAKGLQLTRSRNCAYLYFRTRNSVERGMIAFVVARLVLAALNTQPMPEPQTLSLRPQNLDPKYLPGPPKADKITAPDF